MAIRLVIPKNHKYAFMNFRGINGLLEQNLTVTEINNYWLSPAVPEFDQPHWKEWLGTLRFDDVASGQLIGAVIRPSENPHVLDGENQKLKERIDFLFNGILIAVPFMSFDSCAWVSGGNVSEQLELRQVGFYDPTVRANIAPWPHLSLSRLEEATTIGLILEKVYAGKDYQRLRHMVTAFKAGLETSYYGFRIHQFVRTIDGFLGLEKGQGRTQFASRSELFLGPSLHSLMQDLYDIRSAVEHLHPPQKYLPDMNDLPEDFRMDRYLLQAEFLAQSVLKALLLNDNVREMFKTENGVNDFWAMETDKRKLLFPSLFDPVGFLPTRKSDFTHWEI